MKKRIVVADADRDLERSVKTFCNPAHVSVGYYSKGVEILPIIEIEDPSLVFLSLDLSDINDFVVFDILKRCTGESTAEVYIVYSEESEGMLGNIMKMKFKASGYLKKPVDKTDIADIIQKTFDSSHYLIPTDVTMKEILDDDDILDLGSVANEVKESDKVEMDTNDIVIENFVDNNENSDPGTKDDFRTDNIERIEAGPADEELPDLEDQPFQISDDEFVNEAEKLQKALEEKEREFMEERKKLLRDIKTSEFEIQKKDKEKQELAEKIDKLQNDYEEKIRRLNEKYKEKLKKFQEFLNSSMSDIDES